MKKHPVIVEGFNGTLEELAQSIFRMRYDEVVNFLAYAQKELNRQSKGDEAMGRVKLSLLLFKAQLKTEELKKIMDKIFALCKPFMRNELGSKKANEKVRIKKLEEACYMMATKASHYLGDVSRKVPTLCIVHSVVDGKYFIGSWDGITAYSNIKFPVRTTRELTEEEKKSIKRAI